MLHSAGCCAGVADSMHVKGWIRRRVEAVKEDERLFSEEVGRFSIGAPKRIVVLPGIDAIARPKEGADLKRTLDVRYELIPPFAYARLHWNDKGEELIYEIIQPSLSADERSIFEKIQVGLAKNISVEFSGLTGEAMLSYVQKEVNQILDEEGILLKPGQYTRLLYYIYINFVGLNEIEPVMHDSYIEDIGCDGVEIPIYVTHKKYGNIKTNIVYGNKKSLEEFVVKLAERAGRYISYAEPLLDGSLPDGSRVQATLTSDVTTRGPTFSIRKFREIPYSAIDLIRMNTSSSGAMAYLWFIIEHKRNVLICGGTGAGKTSFLNSLVSFIPPEDKIVSIEDTRELNLPHENWIPAVARVGFGTMTKEGVKYGEVSMFDLLKESFRQRPDYVIVGEVRGVEASVLFQGMASGHPSLGTIHGGSVDDIIKRMETPPISLPPSLLESLDVVIVITHTDQLGKATRRVKEIVEIQNIDADTGRARTLRSFQWSPIFDKLEMHHSDLLEKIGAEYGLSPAKIMEEVDKRKRFLEWLMKKKLFGFMEFSSYIAEYYRNREKVMGEMEAEMPPEIKEDEKPAEPALSSPNTPQEPVQDKPKMVLPIEGKSALLPDVKPAKPASVDAKKIPLGATAGEQQKPAGMDAGIKNSGTAAGIEPYVSSANIQKKSAKKPEDMRQEDTDVL